MKCGFSEERIALYVEDDLHQAERLDVEAHLLDCVECREFASGLRESQSVFKSLREETVTPAALAGVRERVLMGIESGWALRLERLLLAGLRWRYALAGLALVAVVSGSVWVFSPPGTGGVAAPIKKMPATNTAQTGRSVETNPSAGPDRTPGKTRRSLPTKLAKVTPPAAPDKTSAQPPPLYQGGNTAPEPRQIVVKLLTDDPNIVIYWLVDEKNGGER